MLFQRTFSDLISLVEKSTLFPGTVFDVISMVEKSMSFPRTFFDVISVAEKSRLFPRTLFRCNFSGRNIHVVSTYFLRGNCDGKKLTSLLVTCKLMKTFWEIFLCL